nr:amidohydrolase family protein [Streptomyces sp. S1D4-11]
MDLLGTSTAIVSVSTPGTGFLTDPGEAADLARRLNDFSASLAADHAGRFGYFATLPMPDAAASAAEARRALEELGADGVTLLANNQVAYLGAGGQDALWRVLDERGALVFVHPAELPATAVEGIPPFAADFLLDTTRAAYLLVRNGITRTYPNIRFILSHAGGFVPYASHRMAVAIASDTGRSPLDVLDDFRAFYFDTPLSSSPAALPTLLAFARPGHVLFGSDWPFAPTPVSTSQADSTPAWTPTSSGPSTAATPKPCSPAWPPPPHRLRLVRSRHVRAMPPNGPPPASSSRALVSTEGSGLSGRNTNKTSQPATALIGRR